MYLDIQTAKKLHEIFGFGPSSIQFITCDLSSVDAGLLCKPLAAQVQRIPQLFNSETK